MFLRRKKNHETFDDLELVRDYRDNGNREAIGILFERYTHLVYGICLKYLEDREDSRDAVMQIFEKLMDDLLKHEVSNFSSWLHSVARNFCLMKIRADKSRSRQEQEYRIHEELFVELPEGLHQENGQAVELKFHLLEKAISSLNDEQQMCIRLFYFEGKSYTDIVTLTGLDQKKVKSHLQNGKRNLKLMLEKDLRQQNE